MSALLRRIDTGTQLEAGLEMGSYLRRNIETLTRLRIAPYPL